MRRLFVTDGPGAGLVEKPVRLSEFVSFRGEKRALGDKELTKLAAELVNRAVAADGERPLPEDETTAVVLALAATLRTLVRRPGGLPAPDGFLDAIRVPFHAVQPSGWADRVLTAGRPGRVHRTPPRPHEPRRRHRVHPPLAHRRPRRRPRHRAPRRPRTQR